MSELVARVDGIELAYETFGDAGDPAVLLVMGLGAQMLLWEEDFCALLVEQGRFVVRFDNRDVGRSSWIEGGPDPDILAALQGDTSTASYKLEEMAGDAVGLLHHLEIDGAHVVGASMGGMIAQTIAIRHPQRVLSLTSIMSTTGDPEVGKARPEVLPLLLTPAPAELPSFVEYFVSLWRTLAGPAYPPDEERLRTLAARVHERGVNPRGTGRQLLALLASGDRTAALATVTAPTVVLHGEDDPLIDVSGGRATAAAIPGAQLTAFPGMGHDLPRELWPQIVELVATNAASAQRG
ncbi:MAG: alpha/beta fold hydrolase [Solirubrobacteraceae bacterium]|nr:MAG: alpha/beta hydrolase [Solirubrobacterales bacterium]